jgi:hypothetical protein
MQWSGLRIIVAGPSPDAKQVVELDLIQIRGLKRLKFQFWLSKCYLLPYIETYVYPLFKKKKVTGKNF